MDNRIGILFAVEIAKVARAIGIKVVHEARQGEAKETRLYNNVPPLQSPMSRDSKLLYAMDNQSTVRKSQSDFRMRVDQSRQKDTPAEGYLRRKTKEIPSEQLSVTYPRETLD